jgi:hypothetical protein
MVVLVLRRDDAMHRGFGNFELMSNFPDADAAGLVQCSDLFPLSGSRLFLGAADPAPRTGIGKPCSRSFTDSLALVLRQEREYFEDEFTHSGRRVQILCQRHELNLCLSKLLNNANQINEGTAKPIKFPDDKCVPCAKRVEAGPKLWTIGTILVALRFFVNARAFCLLQCSELKFKVLVFRGNPRIADFHEKKSITNGGFMLF